MKHLFKRILFAATVLAAEFCLTSVQGAAGDLYDGGLNSHSIYKFTPAGVQEHFRLWDHLMPIGLPLIAKEIFSHPLLPRSRRSLPMARLHHRLPLV